MILIETTSATDKFGHAQSRRVFAEVRAEAEALGVSPDKARALAAKAIAARVPVAELVARAGQGRPADLVAATAAARADMDMVAEDRRRTDATARRLGLS